MIHSTTRQFVGLMLMVVNCRGFDVSHHTHGHFSPGFRQLPRSVGRQLQISVHSTSTTPETTNESPLQVLVAESRVIPGERGLFLQNTDAEADAVVEAGDILCAYSSQGLFVEGNTARNDKAVAFYLDTSSLIVFQDEVMPLQRLLLRRRDVQGVAGHRLHYYGPFQQGIRMSIDQESMAKRTYVPAVEEGASTRTGVGQFANDLAFSPDDMSSDLAYRERAAKWNHFVLCWNLNSDETGTLVPQGLSCVTTRDFVVPAATTIELGCYYGMEYWRNLLNPESD